MSHLDQQAQYQIVIEGSIDHSLADWCGPLTLAGGTSADGSSVTILSRIRADQAGLVGVIRYLHGLGIVLLSVERCLSPSAVTGEQAAVQSKTDSRDK